MPNQTSSTAQDLARGKPSEIDFLNGHVVRKGAELGIADADQPGPAGDGEAGGARQGDRPGTGSAAGSVTRAPEAVPACGSDQAALPVSGFR